MRYKNIHNIIIEGPNGVGKSTLIQNLFKYYNYRYMCYHRGEISNYLFATKFGRPYFVTQNKLPFLYIVLLCDKNELSRRIIKRGIQEKWSHEELDEELKTIVDNDDFIKLAKEMSNDYDIEIIDTTNLTEEEVLNEAVKILDKRNLEDTDLEISTWNEMYDIACKKYGLDFTVKDNQPYINHIPINVESTLHNGVYETFSDKRYPDNLLYTLAYDTSKIKLEPKQYDFVYIINSKIKRRPEVFDYYKSFVDNGKTCLIADNDLVENNELLIKQGRIFKEDFIGALSKAKATVYTSRDLAYLKLQTARLYESILADNIIFVDSQSDLDNEILSQIYGDDKDMIELMTVDPSNIVDKYNSIINNQQLVDYILKSQHDFYNNLVADFENNLERKFIR